MVAKLLMPLECIISPGKKTREHNYKVVRDAHKIYDDGADK